MSFALLTSVELQGTLILMTLGSLLGRIPEQPQLKNFIYEFILDILKITLLFLCKTSKWNEAFRTTFFIKCRATVGLMETIVLTIQTQIH